MANITDKDQLIFSGKLQGKKGRPKSLMVKSGQNLNVMSNLKAQNITNAHKMHFENIYFLLLLPIFPILLANSYNIYNNLNYTASGTNKLFFLSLSTESFCGLGIWNPVTISWKPSGKLLS